MTVARVRHRERLDASGGTLADSIVILCPLSSAYTRHLGHNAVAGPSTIHFTRDIGLESERQEGLPAGCKQWVFPPGETSSKKMASAAVTVLLLFLECSLLELVCAYSGLRYLVLCGILSRVTYK